MRALYGLDDVEAAELLLPLAVDVEAGVPRSGANPILISVVGLRENRTELDRYNEEHVILNPAQVIHKDFLKLGYLKGNVVLVDYNRVAT